MTTKLHFKLTRPARSKGGDRYEADLKGEDKPIVFYFPQKISRASKDGLGYLDVPANTIAVTVEVID